ncbi:MAG: hypothetical protein HC916_15625 [Coleofasciculaceae cyanobacterium SM2_1_6]|nr:hypothetical protein [Coleofasciculaceae cyanobacterium SM2_1_6]
MTTKTHLITADSYVNKGIGLKHGDPTISVRLPVAKKQELEEMIDRLVALGKTKNKQDFLRGLLYQAIDENKGLLDSPAEDTIAPTPADPVAIDPPASTPKKTRGRKTSKQGNMPT